MVAPVIAFPLAEIAETFAHIALWTAVVSLFVVGLLGTILPILPGLPLIWLGIFIHQLFARPESVGWNVVVATGVIAVLAQVADYALSYWGVKRFGGTWRGGVGAVVGLLVGIFLPPPLLWIIIGPMVGAVAGEMLGGSPMQVAGKAGFGTLVGGLLSFVLKIGLGMGMIGLFIVSC